MSACGTAADCADACNGPGCQGACRCTAPHAHLSCLPLYSPIPGQVRIAPGPDGLAPDDPATAELLVTLWRADAVSGIMELNASSLRITKCNDAAALLMGCSANSLVKRDFRK